MSLTRKARVRPRNAKRRQREFARCYHSRERVRWVRSLPCLACGHRACSHGLRDNAHTVTGGMGRKADYATIVPLCSTHHRCYDEHRAPFDRTETRDWLKARAAKIEAMWQAQSPSVIRPHDA